MLKAPSILLLFVVCVSLLSCSSSQPGKQFSLPPDTSFKYTSSFPHGDVSRHLQEAQKSIFRLVSTGSYLTYVFERNKITLADIHTNDPKDIASHYFTTNESSAGTSILLEHTRNHSLLITCEHVVSFPDTVISYYQGEEIPEKTFIESIS